MSALDFDLSDVVVDGTVNVDCDDVDDERILRCWLKNLLMTGNLYDKQHENTYNNNNIAQDFNINTSTLNLITQELTYGLNENNIFKWSRNVCVEYGTLFPTITVHAVL